MKKNMICIVCPVGCHVTIDEAHNVTGNRCKRGITYAVKELTNPTRMVTSTVKINSTQTRRMSVKTSDAIDKTLIFNVIKALETIELNPPVHVGDVIIKDIFDSGIDIVATRTVQD